MQTNLSTAQSVLQDAFDLVGRGGSGSTNRSGAASDGLLEEDLFVDCNVQRVKVKLCSWRGLVEWAIADRKLGRFDGSVESVA